MKPNYTESYEQYHINETLWQLYIRLNQTLSQTVQKTSSFAYLLLFLLILSYTVYFSWYTINRHNSLNSYAADLSLIDQPMWNTVRGAGDFMELTWGTQQQPRLAEHFEPILIPLAWLFFLWDDVRILLIAQSLALALGAIPVFWIARSQLAIQQKTPYLTSTWYALIFVVAYLLSPHLQAANIADFHADPFAVAPLLFAFWYATKKRWFGMWFWAIIVMATKENLPTLTAMLGLYILFTHTTKTERNHGLALLSVSVFWFVSATFFIVAPLAREYFGTDGPIYFANRYEEGLNLSKLFLPARRWYLIGLFASFAWLPLFAPELLLLGLPVLAANLLSNYPGQYSGEQHYSAPLVAAFSIAAIYGTRCLMDRASLREINRQMGKTTTLINISLWLLMWSLSYHTLHGWTPLSYRQETYEMTPAATLLPQLTDSIPPEATVSASAAIHPHLAHRQVIYTFPTVEEATYLLVDVTDIPGAHPNDARQKILEMLQNDWQLLQAKHGLLLAQRNATITKLSSPLQWPDDFYDFARTVKPIPNHPTPLNFGDGRLHLLGYDVQDDPDDGLTFRFYWQTSQPLPNDLQLWPLIYDDMGRLLSDPTQVPMIATVWYPPAAWQPGETIITETLPQPLPDAFHLGLAVGPQNSFHQVSNRYPILSPASKNSRTLYSQVGHWVQLASFQRRGPFLIQLPALPTLQPLTPTNIPFDSEMALMGYWLESSPSPEDHQLNILLQWITSHPLKTDLTVFIHLLDSEGHRVAQNDSQPTWLTSQPTSQWSPHRPYLDQHTLLLPPDLPPGSYTIQLGLYHPETLERIPLSKGKDSYTLGQIQIK